MERKNQKKLLTTKVKKFTHQLWIPKQNIKFQNTETHSWFDGKFYYTHYPSQLKIKNNLVKNKQIISTRKIKLSLNNEQKQIMLKWLNACIKMYNECVFYINDCHYKEKQIKYGFYNLRKKLKNIKNKIIQESQIETINHDTKIRTHILDYTIKRASANFRSCLSNLKNKNIKHFRVRYLKFSKTTKILRLENNCFSSVFNTICKAVFGDKIETDNFDLTTIKGKKIYPEICYNKDTDIFWLCLPYSRNKINNKNKEITGIDAGIRTFLTGISNKEVYEIGNNVQPRIKSILRKIDNLENRDTSQRIKDKFIPKWRLKIKNLINDLHWKSINELTKHFNYIVIGKLSTSNIIKNGRSKLNKMTKRVSQSISFYKFLDRLKYKCDLTNTTLKIIDESYTSKVCSVCSNIKEDLGSNKLYKCTKCKTVIGRDINSARNMILKNLK